MAITATELRKLISDELESLGFSLTEKGDLIPPTSEKESITALHKPSREIELEKAQGRSVEEKSQRIYTRQGFRK